MIDDPANPKSQPLRSREVVALSEITNRRPGRYRVEDQVQYERLEQFAGARAHGLPGIHAAISELLRSQIAPGSSVLDLACGAGALSLRLKSEGYSVSACDLIPDKPQFRGEIPLIAADLNEDFTHLFPCRYSCVIASEIVEHLENPRHFLREVHGLLEPGGFLAMTTPNVDSPTSHAMAMMAGYPRWFSNHDYDESGHITPMSRVSLERALKECGFQADGFRSVGGSEPIKGWWKLNMVASLLKPLCNSRLTGQILMMWARKSAGNSMTESEPR